MNLATAYDAGFWTVGSSTDTTGVALFLTTRNSNVGRGAGRLDERTRCACKTGVPDRGPSSSLQNRSPDDGRATEWRAV